MGERVKKKKKKRRFSNPYLWQATGRCFAFALISLWVAIGVASFHGQRADAQELGKHHQALIASAGEQLLEEDGGRHVSLCPVGGLKASVLLCNLLSSTSLCCQSGPEALWPVYSVSSSCPNAPANGWTHSSVQEENLGVSSLPVSRRRDLMERQDLDPFWCLAQFTNVRKQSKLLQLKFGQSNAENLRKGCWLYAHAPTAEKLVDATSVRDLVPFQHGSTLS